jgi:AcrR family transcriptional regulator
MAKTQESTTDAKPDRQARRKRATREKLVTTAIRVFNQKGINDTTVHDITEGADVAYGTFYNYFTSIEDLAPQVINAKIREHVDQVNAMQEGIEDIALVVAMSVREFAKKVVSDPTLRWLSERPVIMVEALKLCLVDDAKSHNRIGIDKGEFDLITRRHYLVTFCTWGFTGMLQEALQNPESADEIADDMTRIYLRLLGVENDRIETVLAQLARGI